MKTTFRGFKIDESEGFVSTTEDSLPPGEGTILASLEMHLYECPSCWKRHYLVITGHGAMLEHLKCYYLSSSGLECDGILEKRMVRTYAAPLPGLDLEDRVRMMVETIPKQALEPEIYVLSPLGSYDTIPYSDIGYYGAGGLLFIPFEEFLDNPDRGIQDKDFFDNMIQALEREKRKILQYSPEEFTSNIVSTMVGDRRLLTLTVSNDGGKECYSIPFLEENFKNLLDLFVNFDDLINGNKEGEDNDPS